MVAFLSEFFSHPIPAVILLLGILVLVHEFGHFIVGRWCGIAVETFSVGFGPKIVAFTRNGTEYRLSWVPLGGYVKFAGAHSSEDVPEGIPGAAFLKVSLWRRAATVAAGPVANFLLAIAVYTVLVMNGIQLPPAIIGEVVDESPAQKAGLQYGDKLLKVDDYPIASWRDLEKRISEAPGRELALEVERHGAKLPLKLTPGTVEVSDGAGRKVKIGRAGVALGRLPAIVTVIDPASPAAKATIKTGDRILSLAFDVDGKQIPIGAYPDLLDLLVQAHSRADVTALILTLREAALPSLERDAEGYELAKPADEKGTAERVVTLPVQQLRLLSQTNPNPRQLAIALGLYDSQLTVGEATETLKGVLKRGDRFMSWEGATLRDVFQLGEFLRSNEKEMVAVTVARAGRVLNLELMLKPVEVQRPDGKVTIYTLPVNFYGQPEEPPPIVEQYSNPLKALAYGVRETAVQTGTLFVAITHLISGDVPMKALGGPMLIAKVAGDSARHGWQTFLGSMALISINLGLLNLFPIPVLDGGQLVLMGAEAVRRRPLREAAVENFQKVGFAMIMALVVLATYNDISRFWKSMLESVVGLFQ